MKIINILLSLAAAVVLLTACDAKKDKAAAEETTGEKTEARGIAQQVVDDALSRVRDADADVEDITPPIDETYTSDELDIWMFADDEGTLEARFFPADKGGEFSTFRLSKRGPAAYDAYPGERSVATCVLRIKDGGEVVEMTEGSQITLFKNHDRFMRDLKARHEEACKAEEAEILGEDEE